MKRKLRKLIPNADGYITCSEKLTNKEIKELREEWDKRYIALKYAAFIPTWRGETIEESKSN